MFKFEIIENNSPKWGECIKQANVYDFHHTSYFHQIDNNFNSKLLLFSDDENFIGLPIVIRPIDGTAFFDITSVYGYAGPIYKFQKDYNNLDLISFFNLHFVNFCKENKIVSVFSRLHPLIDQRKILKGLGEISDLNKTLSINLQISPEEQRREYRKSLKSELNQLARKDIYVRESENHDEVDEFISIYYETMKRVGAASQYYFSKEYLYGFLNNSDFKSKLLVAVKNKKIIAGAIFTLTDTIMQYHLAGTTQEFIQETPMKLIIDQARLLGNETTAKDLHLGGGVGGRDDDSLFKFKSAFSKSLKQFSVWKFVVDQKIYDELSRNKSHSSFFPLYRSQTILL